MRRMPLLFGWVGSKWRLAPLICSFMPRHKRYIEPFVGSASILIEKPIIWSPGGEVINDKSRTIADFFGVLADRPPGSFLEFLGYMELLPGGCETLFYELGEAFSNPKEWGNIPRAQRAAFWVFLNRVRFKGQWHNQHPGTFAGCQLPSTTGTRGSILSESDYLWYAKRFKKVDIWNRDALEDDFWQRYDKEGIFMMLDPPYDLNATHYPDDCGPTPEMFTKLYSFLENTRTKFTLTMNSTPELLELIKRERWEVIKTKAKTSLGRLREKKKEFNEILVMNYDPKEDPAHLWEEGQSKLSF